MASSSSNPSVFRNVAIFLISSEFFERLAYYGFAGSLVLYFQTQLHMSNQEADIQYSIWSGISYLCPLIGGYFADAFLGRFRTILVFFFLYVVACWCQTFSSIPGSLSPAVSFVALYFIALSSGGVKPNMSTLGADQFDDEVERDREEKASYFNWYYWALNLGAFLSFSFVSHICQYGVGSVAGYNTKHYSFFSGFLLASLSISMGLFVFLLGSSRYKTVVTPSGSELATCINIISEACRKFVWEGRANVDNGSGARHFLDRAKVHFAGSFTTAQVEGVKEVLELAPVLLALIPFWCVYSQMYTSFQNQACQMDLTITSQFRVPITGLLTINNLSVLSLIPVFDRIIYPYVQSRGIEKSLLRRIWVGFTFVVLSMVAAGLVESQRLKNTPSNPSAAVDIFQSFNTSQISPCQNIDDFSPYEYQWWSAKPLSKQDPALDVDKPAFCWSTCNDRVQITSTEGFLYSALSLTCIDCDSVPLVSSLSVLWQIPQFFLMGTAEVLTVVSALDFFYDQVPPSLRSVASACNLGTCALGAFLAIPVLYAANYWDSDGPWVANDLNRGHLEKYFYLLAALMVLDAVLFWFFYIKFVERSFEYMTRVDGQIAKRDRSPDVSRHRSSSLTDLFVDSSSSASMSATFRPKTFGKSNVYSSLLSHIEVPDENTDTDVDVSTVDG